MADQSAGHLHEREPADVPETSTTTVSPQKPSYLSGRSWQLAAVGCAVLAICTAFSTARDSDPPELTPLRAQRLSDLPAFQGDYRDRMLWGSYRPGLYFGMRMRQAASLQTGLMWFDPDRQDALQNIRHQAQERDGLRKFGWERHDGEAFGRQELLDEGLHLTTSFSKRFCQNCRGGDWAVRVSVESALTKYDHSPNLVEESTDDDVDETKPQRVSVMFYIADEQGTVALHMDEQNDKLSLASGKTDPLGGWKLHAASAAGGRAPRFNFLGVQSQHTHNLSDLVAAKMNSPLGARGGLPASRLLGGGGSNNQLPDQAELASNVAIFQLTGRLPLAVDFVFTGSLTPHKGGGLFAAAPAAVRAVFGRSALTQPRWPDISPPSENPSERVNALCGERLSSELRQAEARFDSKFETTFQLKEADGVSEGILETSKAALSNMLGGLGYFFGRSAVRVDGQIVEGWPTALFTGVPSRSFFPRGFLWDEGFHQLLIQKWNAKLSRDILGSWLDQLNSQGWIAREQILGEEARSRVPAEFIVQDPTAANPPTLFLPLSDMARRLTRQPAGADSAKDTEEAEFLRAAFPRMQAWLDWFVKTQQGKLPGSWRWRGRKMEYLSDPFTRAKTDAIRELNPKTLTSGLDDYPRASHPSEDERHVDLHCWMALAAKSLALIGASLQLPHQQVKPYEILAVRLSDIGHLNAMHYDSQAKQYRDWGNHTENVTLEWRYLNLPPRFNGGRPSDGRGMKYDLVRSVWTAPQLQFVPQYGYVSLFPLAMRLLAADSPELTAQLWHLNSSSIMTPFGLQSLSKESSLYAKRNTEHDPPYWRGPIWINVNFLVLASLHHYSQAGGAQAKAAKELHDDLRSRLMTLITKNYEASGFLWENYDENEGNGRGCRPFTGWTALLVLIAGRNYFEV